MSIKSTWKQYIAEFLAVSTNDYTEEQKSTLNTLALCPVILDGDILSIYARNEWDKDKFLHFKNQLLPFLSGKNSGIVKIKIDLASTLDKLKEKQEKIKPSGSLFPDIVPLSSSKVSEGHKPEFIKSLEESSVVNKKNTFESFCSIKGTANYDAWYSLNRFSKNIIESNEEDISGIISPICLHGKSGVGKTHLVQSVFNYVSKYNKSKKILYITSENFIKAYMKASRSNYVNKSKEKGNKLIELKEYIYSQDIVIIDDIHYILEKSKSFELIGQILETFSNNSNKHIILISREAPHNLNFKDKNISDSTVSRILGLNLLPISFPDKEIIKKYISSNLYKKDYKIDESALVKLSERVNGRMDFRSIESLTRDLTSKLDAYFKDHDDKKRIAKWDTINFVLSDRLKNCNKKQLTQDDVISCVCEFYQTNLDNLKEARKTANILIPRQVIMYLSNELLDTSFSSLADLFNKDISTVSSSIIKIRKVMDAVIHEKQSTQILKENILKFIEKLNN